MAGRPGRLLYNSAVGPLHWLHFDDGFSPSLRFGFNGWASGSQEVVVRTHRPTLQQTALMSLSSQGPRLFLQHFPASGSDSLNRFRFLAMAQNMSAPDTSGRADLALA